MNKLYVLALSFLLTGCLPNFIEKQSEPLKQAVYGVNDSLDKGRVDLAWYYSNETVKLVTPPNKRIEIKEVYEPKALPVSQDDKGQRVVLLPEGLKGNKVVVVNSDEYKELLKNKNIATQLQVELTNQKAFTEKVVQQQKDNEKIQSDLLLAYNHSKELIAKKDTAIWYRNFIILGLLVIIGGYIGLRIAISYGKMSLPFMI
jgi:hypothetical protein